MSEDMNEDNSLIKLQYQLNQIEELAKVMIQLSDERLPIIKSEIQAIVKEIEGGFDKEVLATQMRNVLDGVINKSDYTKIRATIESTTKTMLSAIEQASNQVNTWQADNKKRSTWHYILIAGAGFFCIGFASAFAYLKPSQDILKQNIYNTGMISDYILHQCNSEKMNKVSKKAHN